MRGVLGAVFLGAVLVGCAAASPRSAVAGAGPSSGSAGGSATVAASAPTAPPPPTSPGLSAMPSAGTATTGGGSSVAVAPGATGGIAEWEGRLDHATQTLSTASGDCREICRASGDICVAADEICGITGDTSATLPGDPRCGRARSACSQATQQRNSACPVCPAAH